MEASQILQLQKGPHQWSPQGRWWLPFLFFFGGGDSDRLLLVDYLTKSQSIAGPYYASLIRQPWEKNKKKWRGKLSLEVLFHQDNEPAHKSAMALAAIHDCNFQLVEHPPFSLDLAPSDYYLFPKMKKKLSIPHFIPHNDVLDAIEVSWRTKIQDSMKGRSLNFTTVVISV